MWLKEIKITCSLKVYLLVFKFMSRFSTDMCFLMVPYDFLCAYMV